MAHAEMKQVGELISDALKEMRELWREFDLNNSQGAAMRITYPDGEVKSHGELFDTKAWARRILANPKHYPEISIKFAREALGEL